MGTYDPRPAYFKTQTHGLEQRGYNISTSKTKTFTDVTVKNAKRVPGPGTYKNVENSYAKLSTTPVSLRTHRH